MKIAVLIAILVQLGCDPNSSNLSKESLVQKPTSGSDIEYKCGTETMQGYWSAPSDSDGKRPTILIVHDWNGIDAYEKMRADMIAALGYNAFCIDIYGKGVRPTTQQECSAEAGKYYANNALLLERALAGLKYAQSRGETITNEIGAMGYCFGGMTVLEMARANMELQGVVSFHGSLATKNPMKPGTFKGKVLVCHGNADPVVSKADVEALKAEMKASAIDFKFVGYDDAVHSFTIKNAPVSPATKYNEAADLGSWSEMKQHWIRCFQ